MLAVLFQSHLLTIATEQIHVIVIAFVYKSHSGNQIDLAGNTLKNRLTRNYITSVGQSEIIYPVYDRAERSKIIPCPAAHPFIGQIRKYPLGLVDWFTRSRSRSLRLRRDLFFYLMFSKRSVFSFKVAYEQALYLGQSREVTRKQHAKLMMRVRGAAGSLRSP